MTGAVPIATEAQIRRLAAEWLGRKGNGEVLAVKARPQWSGNPVVPVAGGNIRVVPCPSPLAVRAALVDRAPDDHLVILTDCDEEALGVGLLAHCAKLRLVSIEPWELVRTQFAASALDPALVKEGRWLADALVEQAPAEGWPPVSGAVLTRDHAMRSLAARLLAVDLKDLDSAGILQWTTRSVDVVRYTSLPVQIRRAVRDWLASVAGAPARWAMAAVDAGHGTDAIPLGILAGLLWHADTPVSTAVTEARVRLESLIGGIQPGRGDALAWSEAAQAWLERAVDAGDNQQVVTRILGRTEEIAKEIHATGLVQRSDLLPGALTARIRALAARLRTALPRPTSSTVAAVEAALRVVKKHQLASVSGDVIVAESALRLLRWLATPELSAPSTLADAVARHALDDGWVDRARHDVWSGVNDLEVAAAYQELLAQVNARRNRHDEQFARLLAGATHANAAPGSMLRVEDILGRVVKPILDSGQRVLLLVVDGMSVAASVELVESITANTWLELSPRGGPRIGVLAGLPTVTEVSRTSLFSGRCARGGQTEEKSGLAAVFGSNVRLLHKADLRTGGGASIDPTVVAALQDRSAKLVAAVVNTIDDALDRSDPGAIDWTTDTIRAVRDLLEHARDRVVVLLSDHGHVIDRGTEAELRSQLGATSARWRPADKPGGDGEVLISGSRVMLGNGQVVLPWRETLRYTARKAGYHGGASPAEAVIPLTVLSAGNEDAVSGWAGAPVAAPAWWRGAELTSSVEVPPPTVVTKESQDALFEIVPAAPQPITPAATAGQPLVSALLASNIYRARQKASRSSLPDERVAALLTVLLRAPGGRIRVESLGAEAGIPAHRIGPTLTMLRRLFQVEGYPVLDVDPDGKTAVLNERLLRDQFQLSSGS
ncbi:BREX-2 system phosphatase PglZ [Micromonospora sp. NPDC005206]|uniref:BREX-2 system phosphatase PglZ n=1 Tax=Micromonospora sp. NPDC005206 TaxID=3157022 RepID=UPI0033A2C04B